MRKVSKPIRGGYFGTFVADVLSQSRTNIVDKKMIQEQDMSTKMTGFLVNFKVIEGAERVKIVDFLRGVEQNDNKEETFNVIHEKI